MLRLTYFTDDLVKHQLEIRETRCWVSLGGQGEPVTDGLAGDHTGSCWTAEEATLHCHEQDSEIQVHRSKSIHNVPELAAPFSARPIAVLPVAGA